MNEPDTATVFLTILCLFALGAAWFAVSDLRGQFRTLLDTLVPLPGPDELEDQYKGLTQYPE